MTARGFLMRRKENIPFFLLAEKKSKNETFWAVSGPYRDDFGYPALLGPFSFKK